LPLVSHGWLTSSSCVLLYIISELADFSTVFMRIIYVL
jgi:hypothetical protein